MLTAFAIAAGYASCGGVLRVGRDEVVAYSLDLHEPKRWFRPSPRVTATIHVPFTGLTRVAGIGRNFVAYTGIGNLRFMPNKVIIVAANVKATEAFLNDNNGIASAIDNPHGYTPA